MVSTRIARAGVIALAVCLGSLGVARADEALVLFEGDAELLSQAKALWREGTMAYRKGQLDRARVLYLSALRAQRHHQIAGALGHVEEALGRHREAAEHLSFYLRETRDLASASPRDRAMLERDLAVAEAKIGVVAVTGLPRGADVLVDGAHIGKAPLLDPVFVDPGRHVIEARLEGYVSRVEARELTPGSRAEVVMSLSPTPPPAAPLRPVAERPAMPIVPVRGTLRDPVVIGGAAVTVVAAGVGAALTGWWAGLGASGDCLRAGDPRPCEREWAQVKTASVWTLTGAGITGAGTLAYALVARRASSRAPVSATRPLTFEW